MIPTRKTSTILLSSQNYDFSKVKQKKSSAEVHEAESKNGSYSSFEVRFLASVTATLAAYSAIFFTYKKRKKEIFLKCKKHLQRGHVIGSNEQHY